MRIAILLHLAPRKLGSIEAWLVELAVGLRARGHSVTVFAREPVHPDIEQALRHAGAEWESIDRLRDSALRGVMRLRRFDLLHLSFVSPQGRIAIMSYCAWPARVLFVDHNSRRRTEQMTRLGIRQHREPSGIKKLVVNSLARARLTGVAGVSDYVRDRAIEELNLDARRVTAIHNGVDVARYHPSSQDPDVEDPAFLILCVAHLIPAKGVEFLLRAVAAIDDDDLELRIVGDGSDRGKLEELAESLGLAGRARFCGLRDDVDRLLRQASVFVHPAIWGEAFGLTIAEALASGCPVVASDVGGIPELVEDGKSGLLVPPADPEALAAAIRRLKADSALRDRLAAAGRKRAVEHFGLERSVKAHVAWCEEAGR